MEVKKIKKYLIKKEISNSKMALLFKEINLLLESGISILNTLEILSLYLKDKNLKSVIKRIEVNLENGNSISESFNKTNLFPKFIIVMLKVGEESGHLDSVTKTIYLHFEEKAKLYRKILNSLIYPIFVLITTFIAALILMFKIVPLFEEVFVSISDNVPEKTRLIIEISHVLRGNYLVVIFILLIIILIVSFLYKNNGLRNIMNHLPIVAKINYEFNCYIFTKSLYLLHCSGVSLNTSLNMLQDIINDKKFNNKLNRVVEKINMGYEFNTSLQEEKIIDLYSLSLIAIGEQSGSLDKVLLHISEKSLIKIKNKLKFITYMISPISLIFVGTITFFILSSLIVPLYENINMIG